MAYMLAQEGSLDRTRQKITENRQSRARESVHQNSSPFREAWKVLQHQIDLNLKALEASVTFNKAHDLHRFMARRRMRQMKMAHQETLRNLVGFCWIEKIKTFIVIGCVVYLALALHRAYVLRQIRQVLGERETTTKKMGNWTSVESHEKWVSDSSSEATLCFIHVALPGLFGGVYAGHRSTDRTKAGQDRVVCRWLCHIDS